MNYKNNFPYFKNRIIRHYKEMTTIGITFIFFYVFIVSCNNFTAKAEVKTESPIIVKDFIQKLSKNEITKIEIYYFNWSIKDWRGGRFKEQDLINNYSIKTTINSSKINCSQSIRSFTNKLESFKFFEAPSEKRDYRLGYLFYSNEQEVCRMFFFSEPIIQINGKFYYCNTELLTSLIKLLPNEDMEEIYEYLIGSWQRPYTEALLKELDPQAYEKLYGGKIKDSNNAQ